MKRLAAAFALLIYLVLPSFADNPYVIDRDGGGWLPAYQTYWSRVRNQYDRVVINGPCKSACTMLFGHFSLDRICITLRGSISFHAAHLRYDKSIIEPKGVRILRANYPAPILKWVDAHHALDSTNFTTMSYHEATKYIASCSAPAGFKKNRELLAIVHNSTKRR